MENHWLESLKTTLVNVNASVIQQLLLSKVEIVDDIKRSQDQRFNGKLYCS